MTIDELKTVVRDAFPSIDYLSVHQDCLDELGQVLLNTETGIVRVDIVDRRIDLLTSSGIVLGTKEF